MLDNNTVEPGVGATEKLLKVSPPRSQEPTARTFMPKPASVTQLGAAFAAELVKQIAATANAMPLNIFFI
jgi:hypothetical protein